MPIMVQAPRLALEDARNVKCLKTREIWHFGQEAIMSGCPGQAKFRPPNSKGSRHAGTASGLFQRVRRAGAPDLEADRTRAKRFRSGVDAHHHLCRLPAARRDLCA